MSVVKTWALCGTCDGSGLNSDGSPCDLCEGGEVEVETEFDDGWAPYTEEEIQALEKEVQAAVNKFLQEIDSIADSLGTTGTVPTTTKKDKLPN